MTDYQKYINALRKCAKEHENDRTSTGHIIVSDLCRDTANLLESLEQEPRKDEVILTKEEYGELVSSEFDNGYAKGYREALEQEPTTKNDLGIDCISRQEVLRLLANSIGKTNTYLQTKVLKMPSVTPQEPFINKPCVSSGVCEHDKQHVLDKVMSDIEQRPYGVANDSVIRGMKYERAANLELLDKYKAESEDKE